MDRITKGETHHFLANLIGQQPIVMIIVDEKTPRLAEVCKCLNPRPDIIEFKTFVKNPDSNHAHLVSRSFEALETSNESELAIEI